MKAAMVIALACSAGCLAGCEALGPRADTDPADTVRQKFAAFDRHDVSAIEKLYAADAVLHSPDYPKLMGNSQIADTYRRLFDAIPDARDELQSLDVSGDKVYAQFFLAGHWLGAADKPVKVPILSVYTVKDDRIVGDSTYYDRKVP